MMLVRAYYSEKKTVLMMDGTKGVMPDARAVRLLCSRDGVGADRLIVFTGTEAIPSFHAFRADGREDEMTAEDYALLARSQADAEIHLTDSFVQRMLDAERVELAIAG